MIKKFISFLVLAPVLWTLGWIKFIVDAMLAIAAVATQKTAQTSQSRETSSKFPNAVAKLFGFLKFGFVESDQIIRLFLNLPQCFLQRDILFFDRYFYVVLSKGSCL